MQGWSASRDRLWLLSAHVAAVAQAGRRADLRWPPVHVVHVRNTYNLRCLQVKMGPSFLIPNGVVGCFGSVTPFRSMVPKRSDLFDVAVGGPAAGAAVATGLFLAGLAFSAGGQVRAQAARCSKSQFFILSDSPQVSDVCGHGRPWPRPCGHMCELTPSRHRCRQRCLNKCLWTAQEGLVSVPSQFFQSSLGLGSLMQVLCACRTCHRFHPRTAMHTIAATHLKLKCSSIAAGELAASAQRSHSN